MAHQLAISPDVSARALPTWFVLNTHLQQSIGTAIHATLYDDFAALRGAYAAGQVDLVYANAADTVLLVREYGYLPVARPRQVADEAVVVVAAGSGLHTLEDLPVPLSVAATDAPDVERICRILLEPADVGEEDLRLTVLRNYVLVAKAVLTRRTTAGFFLRKAYDGLAEVTRRDLHAVISSHLYVVSHCLLVSPTGAALIEPLWRALEAMGDDPRSQEMLGDLGAPSGWERAGSDDTEFMVDLMEALRQ